MCMWTSVCVCGNACMDAWIHVDMQASTHVTHVTHVMHVTHVTHVTDVTDVTDVADVTDVCMYVCMYAYA